MPAPRKFNRSPPRRTPGTMNTPLDNIRIVLVGTQHPGNIGSAARAMKTMGLHGLHLVAPERFPDPDAAMMAAGADDLHALGAHAGRDERQPHGERLEQLRSTRDSQEPGSDEFARLCETVWKLDDTVERLTAAGHTLALAGEANRAARGACAGAYPITPQTEIIEYLRGFDITLRGRS